MTESPIVAGSNSHPKNSSRRSSSVPSTGGGGSSDGTDASTSPTDRDDACRPNGACGPRPPPVPSPPPPVPMPAAAVVAGNTAPADQDRRRDGLLPALAPVGVGSRAVDTGPTRLPRAACVVVAVGAASLAGGEGVRRGIGGRPAVAVPLPLPLVAAPCHAPTVAAARGVEAAAPPPAPPLASADTGDGARIPPDNGTGSGVEATGASTWAPATAGRTAGVTGTTVAPATAPDGVGLGHCPEPPNDWPDSTARPSAGSDAERVRSARVRRGVGPPPVPRLADVMAAHDRGAALLAVPTGCAAPTAAAPAAAPGAAVAGVGAPPACGGRGGSGSGAPVAAVGTHGPAAVTEPPGRAVNGAVQGRGG